MFHQKTLKNIVKISCIPALLCMTSGSVAAEEWDLPSICIYLNKQGSKLGNIIQTAVESNENGMCLVFYPYLYPAHFLHRQSTAKSIKNIKCYVSHGFGKYFCNHNPLGLSPSLKFLNLSLKKGIDSSEFENTFTIFEPDFSGNYSYQTTVLLDSEKITIRKMVSRTRGFFESYGVDVVYDDHSNEMCIYVTKPIILNEIECIGETRPIWRKTNVLSTSL